MFLKRLSSIGFIVQRWHENMSRTNLLFWNVLEYLEDSFSYNMHNSYTIMNIVQAMKIKLVLFHFWIDEMWKGPFLSCINWTLLIYRVKELAKIMIKIIKKDLQIMIILLMSMLSACILVDASITTKNQYFKKIQVSASSLDKHGSTLATYNHLRFFKRSNVSVVWLSNGIITFLLFNNLKQIWIRFFIFKELMLNVVGNACLILVVKVFILPTTFVNCYRPSFFIRILQLR